jgi:hypothetical protein
MLSEQKLTNINGRSEFLFIEKPWSSIRIELNSPTLQLAF